MPRLGDGKLLFSFDFLVERLTSVDVECSVPGVTFNLLDFPLVLVKPPVEQHPSSIIYASRNNQSIDVGGKNERCVKFNKGKSCRFEMRLKELVEGLTESGVQVSLVDLVQSSSSAPKVLGTAVLELSEISNALQKPTVKNRMGTEYSAGRRQELSILEASNNKTIAKAHIRYHFYATLTHQENMVGFEETSTSVTIPIHTQNDHDSHLMQDTAVLQPLTGPNQHSSSEKESQLHATEHTTTVVSSNLQSPEVVRTEHLDNDYQLLYFPNSVCPPPLFYQPQPQPDTGQYSHSVGEQTGDCYMGTDTTMNHWSVLMAHDHCSHPVTMKWKATVNTDNTTASQQLPSNQPVALPLLSALMDELLLLKSHAESAQSPDVASLSYRREPEKATKCLQTDENLTTPISQPAKKPVTARVRIPSQPTWHMHRRAKRFVRECCVQKHINSATLVPRNKSVIYPPDIVHKRRKAANLRNKIPTHIQFDTHKEGSISKVAKSGRTVPKHEQKPLVLSPLQGEKVFPAPDGNQGEGRTLEVFIPQATYMEGDLSQSGSVASLHRVHVDAETQTAVSDSLQFESSKDQLHTESVRPSDVISPPLSPKNTVQSDDTNRDLEPGNVETSAVSLATQKDHHGNLSQETKQDALQPSDMITHTYKHTCSSLSQEYSGPVVCRRASVGFPISSKPNSLLNVAALQTLDSFLSADSLDVADSTVLPKHGKEALLYLASPQSSGSGHNSASDHSYEQEYSDDFEDLETSTHSSSSSSM